tara:strand:- start:22241 stop:23818 length:1578 start_codon:yes stop_codon:yes gene_type:complete
MQTFGTVVAAIFCFFSSALAAPQRPNVVFFLVDDLGWRDVGCFGSSFYETPNIDRLADQGVRFTDAYAACHVCSPTRASILTGKYPGRLGLTDWIPGRREFPFQRLSNVRTRQQLPTDEQTLAETMRDAGYQTAAIGKWHLGAEPSGPTAHGFDVDIPQNHSSGGPRSYHAPFQLDGLDGQPGDYLTDRLTDEAERFIETNRNRPFFLYFAHFAVHDPIQGRSDLVTKYEAKRKQLPKMRSAKPFILEGNPDDTAPLSTEELKSRLDRPAFSGHKVLPDRTVKIKQQQDNAQFAAMVEATDESLGRVLAKLEELDLADNTIVIFFADNGGMSAANFGRPTRIVAKDALDRAYSTSNLPLRGAKGWLYEGGIRVPMIVKWPGQGRPGSECAEPVISTDFYPTILEMVGLPPVPRQHVDGVSLVPLIKGGETLQREAIYWHFPHYSNHGMQSPGGAIRAGDFKLIEYFENGTVQLFHLRDDIGEQHDLAPTMPEKVTQLRAMLHRWRKSVSAQMMQPNPDYDASASL